MRFEVLMMVKKFILVFWIVTICALACIYQHFKGTYYPEDRGVKFL
jgi:hypothetical protein